MKRRILRNGFLAVVAVTLTMMMMPQKVSAWSSEFTKVESLPTTAGSTLQTGTIYTVRENITITAPSSSTDTRNALNVAGNAKVVIDIAKGCTLTVTGGQGIIFRSGGAGIHLPSTSTLYVTGGGRLVATGGASGYGYRGFDGTPAQCGTTTSGVAMIYPSRGGAGGYGGGGAGAGIGGAGGTGGIGGGGSSGCDPLYAGGGDWGFNSVPVTSVSQPGKDGADGQPGENGQTMGNLYVLGTVTVEAKAGTLDTRRSVGGVSGGNVMGYDGTFGTAAGGCGGGAGGGGGAALAIGGGGAGGGSGGGGSSGGYAHYFKISNAIVFYGGCGGGGASAAGNGGYGAVKSTSTIYARVTTVNPSSYATIGYSGEDGTTTPGAGGIRFGSAYDNIYGGGGYGGDGGAAGTAGGNGTVYRASTASVNGRSDVLVTTDTSVVSQTLRFEQESGTGGTASIQVTYGSSMGSVTIPTRAGYQFMGYYTVRNGGGDRYFDHRGVALRTYDSPGTLTVLYAYWLKSQYNVTFNQQGGSGGTPSTITTYTTGAGGEIDQSSIGTLPTTITKPTRAHYQFLGYYENAAGTGTQYYDADGRARSAERIAVDKTIYAGWKQVEFPITFSYTGAADGTASAWTTGTDGTLPGSITKPAKTGYKFLGYYSASTGGTQYYDGDCKPVAGMKLTGTSNTLYAQWTPDNFTITYNMNEGTYPGTPTTTRNYTEALTIARPTREGYVFTGWVVDSGNTKTLDLVIPGSDPSWAKNITLTATWMVSRDATVNDASVSGPIANPEDVKKDLMEVFNYVVIDPTTGVTAEEMNGTNKVVLNLEVTQAVADDNKVNIGAFAQGTGIKYYDLAVYKTITPNGGAEQEPERLNELPVPIKVVIPITEDIVNQPAYAVYRIHGNNTERLPVGVEDQDGEYYRVTDTQIIISTRKFSTYGVVATRDSIANGITTDESGNIVSVEEFTSGNQALDVQGRVVGKTPDKLYKIDFKWGDMKYEYATSREWDPDTHRYSEGALNAWRDVNFDGINNNITMLNHSNADVKVSFNVASKIEGVEGTIYSDNDASNKPEYFVLNAATEGASDAELTPGRAFLHLLGTPDSTWLSANKDTFAEIGVITATVEAYSEPVQEDPDLDDIVVSN